VRLYLCNESGRTVECIINYFRARPRARPSSRASVCRARERSRVKPGHNKSPPKSGILRRIVRIAGASQRDDSCRAIFYTAVLNRRFSPAVPGGIARLRIACGFLDRRRCSIRGASTRAARMSREEGRRKENNKEREREKESIGHRHGPGALFSEIAEGSAGKDVGVSCDRRF